MIMKSPTKKQIQVRIRQSLFWYLKGINLSRFINRGAIYNSFTTEEIELVNDIENKIKLLKSAQFNSSKLLGLNPKRRCNCGKTAKYKAIVYFTPRYICETCKKELELEDKLKSSRNPSTNKPIYRITNIEEINPYE